MKTNIIEIGEYMNIILEKLEHADLEHLYEFELKNRTYFEKMVPSR